MSDVSLPPTHPDDEPVTRKILREELANHPTNEQLDAKLANHPTNQQLVEALSALRTAIAEDVAGQIKGYTESMNANNETRLDPYRDVPGRTTALERRSEGHELRISRLEAPRRSRGSDKRARTPRRKPK